MQFAIQYSPETVQLIDDGQIIVDLIKCPDWENLVATAQKTRPVYVHFPLMAGRGTESIDWASIEKFLKTTNTRFVNMHLGPNTHDFPGMVLEATDTIWREQIVERMLLDIEVVRTRFGVDKVILENVPHDPSPRYAIPRLAYDSDVIREVVYESGCGFLLDTAHAHIASIYLDQDPISYLSRMPGDKIRELHITGIVYDDEQQRWHDHFQLSENDWALAEYTFDQIRNNTWTQPEVVAFEYGGVGDKFAWRSETAVIAHDAPRIYNLMQRAIAQPTTGQTP